MNLCSQDPKFDHELRAPIRGFGLAALKEEGLKPREISVTCNLIIQDALNHFKKTDQEIELYGRSKFPASAQRLAHQKPGGCVCSFGRFPNRERVVKTAEILFEMDEEMVEAASAQSRSEKIGDLRLLLPLLYLLLAMSRIRTQELEKGADALLAVKALTRLGSVIVSPRTDPVGLFPDIVESFQILAYCLFGQRYPRDCIDGALLLCHSGWSLFFDILDATDPSDVSLCDLRFLAGAPAKEEGNKTKMVKEKIVDGPTELSFSDSRPVILKSEVQFFPGVSTAKRGAPLIGFRDDDTFLITQSFSWNFKGKQWNTHIMGFREMLEIRKKFNMTPPCGDVDKERMPSFPFDYQLFSVQHASVTKLERREKDELHLPQGQEHAIRARTPPTVSNCSLKWIFHVTENPAARWLQMDDMLRHTWDGERVPLVTIRNRETCMACACLMANLFCLEDPECALLL